MVMKCRILSFFVIVASLIVTLTSIIIIANKSYKHIIYAESISFNTKSGGIELLLNTNLVIDDKNLTIFPSNCTVKPEFTISSSNTKEHTIQEGVYTFEDTGRHILKCKIKANENYYIYDSIVVTVVNEITDNTSMYINRFGQKVIYVEDKISLDSLVELHYPNNTEISLSSSNHINIANDEVTAISKGVAKINISLTYDNVTIKEEITLVVRDKIIPEQIGLKLSVGNRLIENNLIELEQSDFNLVINYELTNTDFQDIVCSSNSDIIEIVSCDAPMIIISAKSTGEAIIYISPYNFRDTIFEITVIIK